MPAIILSSYMDAHPDRVVELYNKHIKHGDGFREDLVELTDSNGNTYTLVRCGECGILRQFQCEHANTKWNEDETEMICPGCGIDCT